MNILPISKWDDTTVVFTDTSPVCFDYVYTINRTNARALGTRSPKKTDDAYCPAFYEGREFKLTLTNGYDVWQQLHTEAAARVMPFVWLSVGLWWVFIVFRIVRSWRVRQLTPTLNYGVDS
jgi:hypothetical protein